MRSFKLSLDAIQKFRFPIKQWDAKENDQIPVEIWGKGHGGISEHNLNLFPKKYFYFLREQGCP